MRHRFFDAQLRAEYVVDAATQVTAINNGYPR